MDLAEINRLDRLSEDDIYHLIGQDIFAGEKEFSILTPRQIAEKAKVWFMLHYETFRERICSNTTIRQIYENQNAGNLAAGIIDLIAGALTGIAPATVAYLIYRLGLAAFCKIHWNNG